MDHTAYIKFVKWLNGKRIPLYKEGYSDKELEEIRKNRNVIEEV